MSLALLFAAAPALIALLPSANAHMSIWTNSMYGFENGYEPVTPLANKGFNEWWFHGYANDRPSEVTTLVPGNDLTLEIACDKSYTSFGGQPSSDACPGDSGSYHAGGSTGSGSGWSGNSEENLAGCALAIAFKGSAAETQPEDFTVMSVQENCVRQRLTNFAIPSNLPACPEGGCTCAWFWQGKNSADEMYMIGFRCDVQGGAATTSYPRPAPPRRNAINGPTQPMYWANTPSNLDYTPDYGSKPSYNSAWGWSNGAQTGAFGGAAGGGGSNNNTAGAGAGAGTGAGAGAGNGHGNGNDYGTSPTYGAGGESDYDASSTYGPGPTSTSQGSNNNGGNDGEYPAPTSNGNDWNNGNDGGNQWGNGNGGGNDWNNGNDGGDEWNNDNDGGNQWGNGNGGGDDWNHGDDQPTTTRSRRPRPTWSHDNNGGDGGDEQPPWQELAASPAESESVKKPKHCGRHRRSRARAVAHAKAQLS